LAYTALYPSGHFQKLNVHLHGQTIKKIACCRFFTFYLGITGKFLYIKKPLWFLHRVKPWGVGFPGNWAHSQLHLIRALMPLKPAPKGLTLHLTWIIFPSSSAPKEETYMEKVGYTHCTEDFLGNH
jgi:hypothetical protein